MVPDRSAHFTLRSTSESDTEEIGFTLGRRIDRGMCIAFSGSLGSGKTTLVRGVCRGLGVTEQVISPTFILSEEYAGTRPVIHLDLYRLEHEEEVEALGVFDRLFGETVVLVEWGERSQWITAEADVVIELHMTGGRDDERAIEVRCGERDRLLFEDLANEHTGN